MGDHDRAPDTTTRTAPPGRRSHGSCSVTISATKQRQERGALRMHVEGRVHNETGHLTRSRGDSPLGLSTGQHSWPCFDTLRPSGAREPCGKSLGVDSGFDDVNAHDRRPARRAGDARSDDHRHPPRPAALGLDAVANLPTGLAAGLIEVAADLGCRACRIPEQTGGW